MAGSVQRALVCIDSATAPAKAWISQACPAYVKNGLVQYQDISVVSAYFLDANTAAQLEAAIAPFDYVYAAGLWSLSFTFVVSLFLVSRSSGAVINFIRGRT